MKNTLSFLAIALSLSLMAQKQGPEVRKAGEHGIITEVRYVPSLAEQLANGTFEPAINPDKLMEVNMKRRDGAHVVPGKGLPVGDDPLIDIQRSSIKHPGRMPELVFEADQNSNIGVTDPTGAVGPDHYLAAWNFGFRIFDKDGNPLIPEASLGSVLTGNNTGDPIVLYDHEADRFIITEFDGNPNGFEIAVSEGPDPVNDGWYVYLNQFTTGQFPDYTKFSIWHDGYYVTANIGGGASADKVWAVERAPMLNGDPTQYVGFPLPGIATSGFYSPQGFNWTAGTAPTGDHTIVYLQDDSWGGVSNDHLKLWNIRLDWNNVASSTILGPTEIPTAPFQSVFDGGSFSNLEQPTGPDQDALQATVMNQAQWRSFGSYNSALLNFVVDTDGSNDELAGVRWYELRQDSENDPWYIYQEGTYLSPFNNKHAFSASMAMDDLGNIGMAYTTCSADESIAIYYTGRYASDPLNQMTVEETLIKQGSDDNPGNRLADYVHLTLDPADGKCFWHIAEIHDPGRDNVVGVFCLAPDLANDMGSLSIDSPENGTLTANESITVTIRNYGIDEQSNVPVAYSINGGAWVNEVAAGPIASGANETYTFSQTADLSTVGQTYTIESAVALATDQNFTNDTISLDVTHLFPDDLGVTAIIAPVSSPDLGTAENVVVTIQNFGGEDQSDFEVNYQVNGGTVVTEIVPGPLNGDDNMTYTFATTADFSAFGNYTILAWTNLSGDTDATNDEATSMIEKVLCAPELDCSFGDGFQEVILEDLMNVTDCEPNGYGDFTSMTASLMQGTTHDLTITTGYGDQHIKVWIDFNDDFAFTADEIVVNDYVMAPGQFGGTYTETMPLVIPANAALGDHIMRMKSNWQEDVPADPCEETQYGETEDYTASIGVTGIDEHLLGHEDIEMVEVEEDHFRISFHTDIFNEPLKLSVIDLNGRTIVENWLRPANGYYIYELDMSYAAESTYVVRMWNREASKVKKFVVD